MHGQIAGQLLVGGGLNIFQRHHPAFSINHTHSFSRIRLALGGKQRKRSHWLLPVGKPTGGLSLQMHGLADAKSRCRQMPIDAADL
jgi:hypothetical protein